MPLFVFPQQITEPALEGIFNDFSRFPATHPKNPLTRIFINDVLSDVKGILQEDRTCREEFKN